MLIRYKTGPNGTHVKQALVYTREEHGIPSSRIDADAVKITRRLQRAGYEAYIVGGAVRDLMLGKIPKDFDIATGAEPNQIRKLFRNSRVIGKRFRLVHIFFPGEKIIEVATFRAREAQGFNNVYGDLEEDALRRDFTLNGLYYDPQNAQVIDFHSGVEDIRRRVLRPIIPVNRIFAEDPVRTIRGVKYAVTTGSKIPFLLGVRIRKASAGLRDVSASRLSEEVFKILAGGQAGPICRALLSYRLFEYLFPGFAVFVTGRDVGSKENLSRFLKNLDDLDKHIRNSGESRRSRFIAFLCADFFYRLSPWKDQKQKSVFMPAFQGLKELIRPLSPANRDVEQAVVYLMRQRERYLKTGELPNTLEQDEPRRSPGTASGSTERRSAAGTDNPETPVKKKRRRRRRRPSRPAGQHTDDAAGTGE